MHNLPSWQRQRDPKKVIYYVLYIGARVVRCQGIEVDFIFWEKGLYPLFYILSNIMRGFNATKSLTK